MILTGSEIARNVANEKIIIKQYNADQINTNSYNFRLGDTIKIYNNYILDPKKHNLTSTIKIPSEGFLLEPNIIYLGHTEEIMGSEHFVPIIRGRSSTGRLGLFLNITADLIDIGSINQWTLQMHCVQPVIVYPKMLIGQVTFWHTFGDIMLYKGKYQGSVGPMESLSYME